MVKDSMIVWNETTHTLDCACCLESVEITEAVLRDPDAFVSVLELTQLDHHDCPHYLDAAMAQRARAYFRQARAQLEIRTGSACALA